MNKIKGNIYKGIILLSISFSFMFFLYAPLEVFLGNTNEFWFDILHLLPIISVAFVVSFAILILFQMLLYKVVYPQNKRVITLLVHSCCTTQLCIKAAPIFMAKS